MKAVVILLILIGGTAGAFYIAWMNRNSEKIISAVIPISVAALAGVYMAVFVFGGEPPKVSEFPTMFFFEAPDNLPISLPFRPILRSLFRVPVLLQTKPDALQGDKAVTVYHHLLQIAIIDNLIFRYRTSWRVKVTKFETSQGTQLSAQPVDGGAGRIVSTQELETALAGNYFASQHDAITNQIAVPPDTAMKIMPPHLDDNFEQSTISFENPFVRLTIQIHFSSWGVLFGEYRLMLGQPSDTNTPLREITFIVSTRTEFKRLRSGHPDMPKYKEWAQQIVDELQNELDEQTIWQHSKEQYVFSRQLPNPVNPRIMKIGSTRTN